MIKSKKIQRQIRQILKVAKTSKGTYKLAAGIYNGRRAPLVVATNSIKTNPNVAYPTRIGAEPEAYYKVCHAEAAAILAMKNSSLLHGATIVVTRVNKSGNIGLSRPCITCYQHIKNAGIKKIIYTIDGERYGIEKVGSYEAEFNKRLVD